MMGGAPGGMGTGGGGMSIPRQGQLPAQGAGGGGGMMGGAPPMGGGGASMGRDTIERIVSSLDTGTLLRALGSVGVHLDGAGGMPGFAPADSPIVDQMAPWGQTMVRVPLTQRRPIVDLSQTTDAPQPPMSLLDGAGAPDAGNIAPWAAATAG